jgi:glycosyltransferase involved in cell wall biosynthesis
MKKKLFIFSNESILFYEGKFFCDNIDLKTTPEGLNKKFEINLFGRKTKKNRSHEIKIKKTKIFTNIFSYILSVIKSTKQEDAKYLIISISPYTFFVSIFLRIFGKKPIVYLRSDGFGEYKSILGKIGPAIYYIMFSITCSISNLISCRDYILRGKKGKTISPSQLDSTWLRQPKNTEVRNFKLLYVGRFKVEKGIFSLIDLIKNKKDISLTIVGAEKGVSYNLNQSNVRIFQQQSNKLKLIKHYDDNNIFILPSFTEGHPMVLLEALARRRPVIIFENIKHVIGDKKGIFVSKRNFVNLLGTLNHIKKNYKKIQNEMRKNKLPTNKEFIDKFGKLIDDYN